MEAVISPFTSTRVKVPKHCLSILSWYSGRAPVGHPLCRAPPPIGHLLGVPFFFLTKAVACKARPRDKPPPVVHPLALVGDSFSVQWDQCVNFLCDSDTDMTREYVKSAKIANCYRHAGF